MGFFPILVNGNSYEWAHIVLNFGGVPFASAQAIEYEDRQEMVNIMGAGNRPVSRAYGNFKPTAKLTLLMEEMEAVQRAAPNGSGVVQRIPEFDITVAFLDTENGAVTPTTHTLKNCRIMNNGRKASQGDTSLSCELELVISHIVF